MLKLAEVKFGSTGATQFAVIVGETAKNYKGYRFNASAGSLQLFRLRYLKDETGKWLRDENGDCVTEICFRKPGAIRKDALVRFLDPSEFLREAAMKAARASYRGRLTYQDARASLDGELNTVAGTYGPFLGD